MAGHRTAHSPPVTTLTGPNHSTPSVNDLPSFLGVVIRRSDVPDPEREVKNLVAVAVQVEEQRPLEDGEVRPEPDKVELEVVS